MKLQIVKFGDKYAVRRKWFSFGRYYDHVLYDFSWSPGSRFFGDCLFGSLEDAREYCADRIRDGKVVEEYPK